MAPFPQEQRLQYAHTQIENATHDLQDSKIAQFAGQAQRDFLNRGLRKSSNRPKTK